MSGDLFIYALMTLNAAACVFYLWEGQAIKSLYWLAVVVLNFCLLKLK